MGGRLVASEMEDDQRATETKYHDAVFSDLMSEVKGNPPGARFSHDLRERLEKMPPQDRRALASRTRDGCPPLLLAARRGNVEATEYLIYVCNADLEQRGLYEVAEDRSKHSVTALWCAAVAGRLNTLKVLIEAGADVNAASDTGSTPIRSACFMTHTDVVSLLIKHGADLQRANHNGGTCLINAVQSSRLCTILLDAGALPNVQDAQGKTALHYAAQEHRLDTARLLLQRGADPAVRSAAGDDALTVACIKGASHIMKLLMARGRYDLSRIADSYELLGATQLDEFNDVSAALNSWRHATMVREAGGAGGAGGQYLEKRWAAGGAGRAGCAGLRAAGVRALRGAREWRSAAELRALAADMELMRAHALLVALRVLGAHHRETIFRFMYRGAAYADAFQYQRCIELWSWALRARLAQDSVLCAEACHTAQALTRLLLDAEAGRLERVATPPRFSDVCEVLELLASACVHARQLLNIHPQCRTQVECNEAAVRCLSHAVLAALRAARGAAQRRRVAALARRVLTAGVRTAAGETLLHLAATRLNALASSYFSDDVAPPPAESEFPSVACARLLLRCGADAGALTLARCSPLHYAALPYNFSNELVEVLLEAGAHLDQPNEFGESPLALLRAVRGCSVAPLRYLTLGCLAARALAPLPPPPPGMLPPALLAVLLQHRPAPPDHPPAHPAPLPAPPRSDSDSE